MIAAAVAIILYGLLAEVGGMYGVGGASRSIARPWARCSLGESTSLVLMALAFLTKHMAEFPRLSMLVWFAVTPALMVVGRIVTRYGQRILHSLGYHTRRFAIVGVNELSFQLAENIEASPEMGLALVGFFDDRPPPRSPEHPQ